MGQDAPYRILDKLPPQREKIETVKILRGTVKATAALAELKGIANTIPNQSMLVNAIVLQEAKGSSEIENIIPTQDELYKALTINTLKISPETKEVVNYNTITKEKTTHAMRFDEHQRKLEQIDYHIRKQSTGSSNQFSDKFIISRITFFGIRLSNNSIKTFNMNKTLIFLLVLLSTNVFSQNIAYKKDSINTKNMTVLEVASFIVKTNIDSLVIGNKMPVFASKGINGLAILNDTPKKIAFYTFWFTSCKPCVDEIPMLNELAKEYQEKIDFFAVTFEDLVTLDVFLKNHKFNFHHLIVDRNSLENLGIVSGYPTNVIVIDGTIIYCSHGGTFKESKYYESVINEYHNNYKRILNIALNLNDK